MALVHTGLAAVATKPHRSPLRRALVTLLIIGTIGTTIGAGTFASYNASSSNATSTFATGSIVLGNTVGAGSQCLSSGNTTTIGDTASDAAEASANTNNSCSAAISTSTQRPGDVTNVTMNLANQGNLSGTLNVYGGTCTDANSTDQNYFHGTGTVSNVCSYLQLYLAQTSGTAACKYGKGATGVITGGTALASSIVITNNTNDSFNLTVDGTLHTNVDFSAGATYTPSTLVTAINAQISSYATAAIDPDNFLWISSKTRGASSAVQINTPTNAHSALTAMGMTNGTNNTGGQTTCSFDPIHTVSDFIANFASSAAALSLGGLNVTTTNTYSLSVQLQSGSDNQLQGRKATFDLTWLLQ